METSEKKTRLLTPLITKAISEFPFFLTVCIHTKLGLCNKLNANLYLLSSID